MGRLVKIGYWITDGLLWLWTLAKISMDWTGRTTLLSDAEGAPRELARMLDWLFTTPWWVPAILATVLTASLIAKQWRPERKEEPVQPAAIAPPSVTMTGAHSVASVNQSGGITAGIVNLGKPKRRLEGSLSNEILSKLDRNDAWEVGAESGNADNHELAKAIHGFMKENGFKMSSKYVSSLQTFPPVVGIRAEKSGPNSSFLIVGHQP